MDCAALMSGLIAARMGQVQLAVAAKLMSMNADAGASVAKLIDAAQQNMSSLANVAAGIGGNLDMTV
jgi:hypothetical protein